MNLCNFCSVVLFLVEMYPVLETSKQLTVVVYPVMSVRKCEYLLDFSLCLASMFDMSGMVSPYMWSVFVLLSMITMPCMWLVKQREGEIPPGAYMPGKSLNTVNLLSTLVTMKRTRLFCRQV